MQSSFAGIEIGKRSLIAHTQGLHTVGHNLSNIDTEGYSRQRVEMNATDPLYLPQLNREETPGQIGQGVDIVRIERIRDMILDGRIVKQANGQGYWEARDKYILLTEQVYNEPSDLSVRAMMDRFWESWQELSLHPQEIGARKAVIQRGETLMDSIHQRYYSLKEIREMLEQDISATVKEINDIASQISKLNGKIVKVKAMGDNPNDLMDRRDLLVQRLSRLIDISTDTRDPDEFTVHTGGRILVQGRVYHPLALEPEPENEGYSEVVWLERGVQAFFRGGKLAALVELRDVDVRAEIQKLDMMTINFIDLVNSIHREAYGLNGKTGQDFFIEYPFVDNITGNYDRNGDGVFDSTYVFRITGINSLNPKQQIGLRGTLTVAGEQNTIEIEYYPTDTVEDLVKKINTSGSEVVAYLDRNNRLALKATPATERGNPDFVIRYIEDSGQFLVGYAGILQQSGPEGAYNWDQADAVLALRGGELDYSVAPLSHPSGWIEINPAMKSDVRSIAAGFGENGRPALPGDGSAALAIASLRNRQVMVGDLMSFDEYFSAVVAEIGLKGEEAQTVLETQNLIMKELEDMRQSISGVNIDEELAQMIKFQHGYSAAARFISEVTRMLDTIINRMGA
ncbi:MAG: flagellar hook-associated protein FlgK [Spirochaetes bacterium]|nr:MAG: flagellar hook-associated protein FlgK [Spirochaetota bacterium]